MPQHKAPAQSRNTRRNRARWTWQALAVLAFSLLLVSQPIQAEIITRQPALEQSHPWNQWSPESTSTVREFSNGSQLSIVRSATAVPFTSASSEGKDQAFLPETAFRFTSSRGETLDLLVRQVSKRGFEARIGDLLTIRADLKYTQQGPRLDKQQLIVGNRVFALGDPSTMGRNNLQIWADLEHGLKTRYSDQFFDELREAMTEFVRDESSTISARHVSPSSSGPTRITATLPSSQAIHCSSHIVAYSGTFFTLAACVSVAGCIIPILLHYAAIGGMVAACIEWIQAEVGDNPPEGGDGGDGGGDGGDGGSGG